MKGAGGTPGGIMAFLIGLIMACGGFYLLLNAIVIRANLALATGSTLSVATVLPAV